MRFKLTIVLLLANLAVFFILWRLEQPAVRMPPPPGPIPRDFDPDHLTIVNYGTKETRELERDHNGNWRFIQPLNWPANVYAVPPMITDLQLIEAPTPFSADDLAKSGESLQSYGLEKPAMEVTLQAGKSKTVTLEIGGRTPNGNSIYIMNKADRLISAVDPASLARLFTPLKELLDNNIFSLSFPDIQGLSVRTSPPASPGATPNMPQRVTLVKDGDLWRLDTPVVSPADMVKLNPVIAQLGGLMAVNFLSPTEADAAHSGLDNPFMRIDLKGELTTQTLLVGAEVPNAPEEQYYAKLDSNPTIFTVKKGEPFTTLLDAQETLRERHFLDFSTDKISAINIKNTAGGELRLSKLETGANPWQIILTDAAGVTAPMGADSGQVKNLLDSLRDLTATSFTSDAAGPDDLRLFGLDAPQWKVELKTDKTITVNFGISTDKGAVHYYANIEGSLSVYEIAAIPHFSTTALDYRDRTLESLPAGAQVVSFKFVHLIDDLTDGEMLGNYSMDPPKTNWDLLLKDKTEGEREAIIHLGESVKQFHVASYLPMTANAQKISFEPYMMVIDSPSPTPVPWRYRLEIGVQLPAAGQTVAQSQTLIFYFSEAIKPSLQIGETSDPPAIFELPQDIIGDLRGITRERNQPAQAATALQQLTQPIDPRSPAPVPESAPPASSSVSPAPVAP